MRIAMGALNDFVPGRYAVPQMPVRTDLGDFVPGDFSRAVPTVYIGGHGLGDFVAADFSRSVPTVYIGTGMGDLTPTSPMYPVPQNSVLDGFRKMGLAGCGAKKDDCGCGCSGDHGGGMGDLSTMLDSVTSTVSGFANKVMSGDMTSLAIAGAGALAIYLVFFSRHGANRSAYGAAKKKATAKYREDLRDLRAEYPTAAGRVRRAASAF